VLTHRKKNPGREREKIFKVRPEKNENDNRYKMPINSLQKQIIEAILKSSASNLLLRKGVMETNVCLYVVISRILLRQETHEIIDCAFLNSPAFSVQLKGEGSGSFSMPNISSANHIKYWLSQLYEKSFSIYRMLSVKIQLEKVFVSQIKC
jgi:hypothetical protein